MPTILRKSFTACEQFPALPPTPRKNNRPPFARRAASASAIRSITATSSASMMRLASSRWVRAKDIRLRGSFIRRAAEDVQDDLARRVRLVHELRHFGAAD